MSVLYLLIPIGLVFLVVAIKLLFWAINNGQYDDLDMESHRILFDDDTSELSKNQCSKNKSLENKVSYDKSSDNKAFKNKRFGPTKK